jgi:3-dehydro-L-gulonate 2-dehydrogenase
MNPHALGAPPRAEQIVDEIVASLHNSKPAAEGRRVRYPGERTLSVRAENEKLGLPVDPAVWEQIKAM